MADSKITALTSISTSTDPANDPLVIVDVSDTSMAATGTTKKVTLNQLLGASGTATLASATITGDLTVRTNKLKVDATGVAIGATSASYLFDVRGTDATNVLFAGVSKGIRFTQSASTSFITGVDNTGGASYQPLSIGGSALEFSLSGSTAMTLNATGLGVGRSPSYKLDVAGIGNFDQLRIAATAATKIDLVNNTTAVTYSLFNANSASNGFDGFGIFNGTSYDLRIVSGNVGIGVTPSAWRSTNKAVQVGSYSSLTSSSAGDLQLFNNAYINSGGANIYQSNGFATRYEQYQGVHAWYTAPSGTAGNTATFTQSMTLDASGNFGIGVTPSAWAAGYKVIQGQIGGFALSNDNSSNNQFRLSSNAYFDTTDNRWEYYGSSTATAYEQRAGEHRFFNAPSGTLNTAITFTQAMTLNASGSLLIGQTTAGLDAQGGFWLREASSAFGSSIIINHRTAVGTGNSYAEFTHNGVVIGSISQNGTTGVLYNTTSDYRLKESVQPIANGLARVNALKPSIYKWKADGSNGEGFLAHELAEVVPAAVSGEKDAVNEDGSIKPQGVDMSRVVPILVAAIQELTARVQTLETR